MSHNFLTSSQLGMEVETRKANGLPKEHRHPWQGNETVDENEWKNIKDSPDEALSAIVRNPSAAPAYRKAALLELDSRPTGAFALRFIDQDILTAFRR